MAKRGSSGKGNSTAAATAAQDGAATTGDMLEQRVVAFAEQLGRIVGTVQAKTEGWMDRDALNQQVAGIRDSASELLEQMKTTVASAASASPAGKSGTAKATTPAKKSTVATPAKNQGRSGGVVDAPGKKHRKPSPRDSRAIAADAFASKARSSKPSMKTSKQRGRG